MNPHLPLAGRAAWTLILALVAAEMVAVFEGSMVYVALAEFYRMFGDPVGVGWILVAFLLVSASTGLIGARLADMYGRRKVALALLSFSVLGSLVSALSTDLSGIIAGRALQGLTSAVLPICYGLIRQHLPHERAVAGIGILASVMIVGSGIGMFIGGLIMDHLSWHYIFYCGGATAALAMALIWRYVPRWHKAAPKTRLDLGGAVFFVLPVAAILYAISSAKSWGWSDSRTIALIAASCFMLAFWIWYELRQKNPLVDLRLLGKRQPMLAYLAMAMVSAGPLQAASFLNLLLQQPAWTGAGLGLSASTAGSLMVLPMSMGVIGGPLAAFLTNRRSARFTLGVSVLLLAGGWAAITVYHDSTRFVLAMMLAVALGQVISAAAVPVLVLEAAPAERTSEATAVITTVRPAAMSIGIQFCSYLLASSMVRDPGHGAASYPSAQAYVWVFGFVTLMSLLCFTCVLALPDKRARKVAVAAPI